MALRLGQPTLLEREPNVSTNVAELNDENFDEAIKANALLVVDFWASWCGPCTAIAPIFQDLADHYGDDVKFAKVDTDANESTARDHGIRSLPTVRIYKDGVAVAERIGMSNRQQFIDLVDEHI